MRLFAIPFVLAACSLVPTPRGLDPVEALEVRVAALEAQTPQHQGESCGAVDATDPAREERRERRVQEVVVRVEEQHLVLFEGRLRDLRAKNLPTLGRALPHRGPDGEVNGYRVSGFRRGSIPELLGLQNGDVVHSLDGAPLRSVDEALMAYARVAGKDQVDLQLTRRGEPMDLKVVFIGKP